MCSFIVCIALNLTWNQQLRNLGDVGKRYGLKLNLQPHICYHRSCTASVFPAPAGVSRNPQSRKSNLRSIPRVSGGESVFGRATFTGHEYSPRKRG